MCQLIHPDPVEERWAVLTALRSAQQAELIDSDQSSPKDCSPGRNDPELKLGLGPGQENVVGPTTNSDLLVSVCL